MVRGRGSRLVRARGRPGFGTSLEALRSAPDCDRLCRELRIAHHRMGVREPEAAMVRLQSEVMGPLARRSPHWQGTAGR